MCLQQPREHNESFANDFMYIVSVVPYIWSWNKIHLILGFVFVRSSGWDAVLEETQFDIRYPSAFSDIEVVAF
jgi:hypothetical protein